jgi:hypothetical protein
LLGTDTNNLSLAYVTNYFDFFSPLTNSGGMQPSYDPQTQQITLPPDASPYQLAHERAHEWQQRERTRIWRIHERVGNWPFLARPVRVLVEWEASRYAMAALLIAGRCDRHAEEEAWTGLWSYVRACFAPCTHSSDS